MLYNNSNTQLLLPAGPVQAADSTATVRHRGCQFAGIRLLHLQLHLLLCSTRQQFNLLHALGGPRHAVGSAEEPIALLPPACSGGGSVAGMKADCTLASEAALC